jgi:3-methylfumaryl-CoA hydratase
MEQPAAPRISLDDDELLVEDVIDASRAQALAGLLDLDRQAYVDGVPLPLMWHLAYFLLRPSQRSIGPDGHSTEEFPRPPREGMRRMFAGGRVRLQPGLRIGDAAVARTRVVSSTAKQGRTGRLTFVTTLTEVDSGGTRVLVDERDIVYTEPVTGALTAAEGPTKREVTHHVAGRAFEVDPTLLFRFSALTYNAHRIHYDRSYARNEGYSGLVVHGPLQALLMAQEATRVADRHGANLDFHYRLLVPLHDRDGLIVNASLVVDGDGVVSAGVRDRSGRSTASAHLRTV